MNLNLGGKRALVTGSSAGIGAGIARVLALEGARVVVHGRDRDRAEGVAVVIRSAGGEASVTLGDLTTDEGAAGVADAAARAYGGLDILVNNAGGYPIGGWWDTPAGAWLDVYNSDVVAGVRLIQHLVPSMRERGWGRVIGISSAAGVTVPSNYFPMYACAKAAETYLAGCLAAELTGSGVTANTVSPGPVATDTFKGLYTDEAAREGRPTDWPAVERAYVERYLDDPPLKRLATVDEVAALVAYLASPLADAVTGANYLLDGGYALSGWRRQTGSS